MKSLIVLGSIGIVLAAAFTVSHFRPHEAWKPNAACLASLDGQMRLLQTNPGHRNVRLSWVALSPDDLRVNLTRPNPFGEGRQGTAGLGEAYYKRFVQIRQAAGYPSVEAANCQVNVFNAAGQQMGRVTDPDKPGERLTNGVDVGE